VLTLPRQKTGAEKTLQDESSTAAVYNQPTIDEYLRKRLMPVEGSIPHLPGIEMYGNSIPAGTVGGDLFEYINFQQRYDIDARIQRAIKLSKEFLEPLRAGEPPRNSVDDHVEWLKSRAGFRSEMETEYRTARSSEQVRVAEDLEELYTTAGVLLVDAQGHGIISAKIASTVHDTFHALMLAELDRRGRTTPELFEKLNLRLAQSVTARNALGRSEDESGREIATMEPARLFYKRPQQPATRVAIRSTPLADLYVVLAGVDDQSGLATFEAFLTPLVFWLWAGGLMMAIGTVVVMWPNVRERAAMAAALGRDEALAAEPVPGGD